MQRRLLIALLAAWPAAALRAQDGAGRPRHKISAATLHAALSSRFPLRFGIPGLLELEVSAPQLLLLPARNRLGAALRAEAPGLGSAQGGAGELDVLFDVRYEAADRTVRGRNPEVLALRWPGLPGEAVQRLQDLFPILAREALGDFVLHGFTQQELALPDAMGLEPERVQVQDEGLLVLFGPKKAR